MNLRNAAGAIIHRIQLVVRRVNSAQTANLLEAQDQTGAILARIDKDGKLYGVGGGATGQALVGGDTAGGDLSGTYPSPAVAKASAAFQFTGKLSPASIGANQDDYAPTGHATAGVFRLTSSGNYDITGLAGGADGRVVFIYNIGANIITLKDETTSTAANRFALTADVALSPDDCVILQYDSTTARWRLVGKSVGAALAGHVMEDEGTPLTQRAKLNFVGAGVAATDDAGNDATVVTITGGSLTVKEIDGAPNVSGVSTIQVPNGSLTDNGGGDVTVSISATDSDAIHKSTADEIHGITEKASPVGADVLVIEDSAAGYAKKRVQITNLPAGSSAPADATYWVEDAHADLSAEVVVGTTGITTAAYASRQAAAKAGRLFLPNNGIYVERDTGSAWAPWGPLFPFTAPVDGDFSWVNQGGASVDASQGGISLLIPAGAGSNVRARVKAAPSRPYTITVAALITKFAANYPACGIGWRESGSGKLAANSIAFDGGFYSTKYTNPTTWSANYAGPYTVMEKFAPCIWFKIAEDNTNRTCYFSIDGRNFYQYHQVGRTDFLTADQVLFYGDANNATYPIYMTVLSWKEG